MDSKRTFHLRDLIIFFLVLFFIVGVGYKYLEWDTLTKVISVSNSNQKAEFAKIEENNFYYNTEVSPKIEYLYSDKIKNSEDYLDAVDKIRSEIKITKDIENIYRNMLVSNREKLSQLKFRGFFLLGEPRKFVNSFLTNAFLSYDDLLKRSKIDSVDNTFLEDYFLATRDMEVSNDFFKKAPQNYNQALVKYVQTNFIQLGALEKYSKDDFKFSDEDTFKTNNPYGYEILLKYKDYLKTFYLIMKDIASNDLESASYKSSTLQSQTVALNPDYEKLFGEGDNQKNSISKTNLISVANMVKASKDFASQGIKEYPLLGKVGVFNGDLAMCFSYISKASGLYNKITSKYPSATDSKSLIKEIAKIEPNTDFVDSTFDYGVLRVVSNDDKSIEFECLDKSDGRVYKFETLK